MGDKDRGSAALAGAAGAVAAEVVAEAITDNAIKNIHAEAKAEGKVLTEAEFQERFSTTLEMTTDWGRLGAAVTALVTDLDANIATATAANAVNNNLIPMLIAVGYVAYVAYDVYDTYQEKGLDAAVLKLGFEVGMVASGTVAGAAAVKVYQLIKTVPKIVKGVVVGVERIVEISAPNAKIAWAMYMEAHPGIAMVMNKLMGRVTAGIDKVAAGVDKVAAKVLPSINKAADKVAAGVERFKKFDDKLDAAVLGSLAKGAEKLGFSIEAKQAAKVVATDAAESVVAEVPGKVTQGNNTVAPDLAEGAITKAFGFLSCPIAPALPARGVPNAGRYIKSFVTVKDEIYYRVYSGDRVTG
jgi:hypothetical protein